MENYLEDLDKKDKYFFDDRFYLLQGDSIDLLTKLQSNSIDMIFADPPYFLSNGGITCKSGEMVSVNKAEWDKSKNIAEIHDFNKSWLKECKRVLKENGTIWISGTYHNIYSLGMALLELKYKILNNVVWYKKNPPPNLGRRCFTHANETLIWAKKHKKSKHYFDYDLMRKINNNKQMKDVWKIGQIKKDEKKYGKHPTQKPLELLERIVVASTKEEMLILDPFNGSGTTGIAAANLKRSYIGIDQEKEYLALTVKRYKDLKSHLKLF